MTKQTHVKIGGIWKPCTSIWINSAGLWKQDVMPKVRVGGVYKECMEYDPYAPVDGNEFTWNGLTYKVVVKDYGGGVRLAWLDRNLGASTTGTAYNDSQAYGDLYQWGRLTDGHEKRNSGTTSTTSATDVPGHGLFILHPFNWRTTHNHNLWQGVDGINNPSPPGWRLPTINELEGERLSWYVNNHHGAYASVLKLTMPGWRGSNGSVNNLGVYGIYWSSNVDIPNGGYGYRLRTTTTTSSISATSKVFGFSVRCVRSDI